MAFDSYRFIEEAKLINEKGFYNSGNIRKQSPLYPLIIAIFGAKGYALPLFQLFLNLLTLFFIYRITLQLFGKKEALIALTIATLYAPFCFYSLFFIRAVAVTFGLTAILWVMTEFPTGRLKVFLAGLLSAVAYLIRPYPLSLLLLFVWYLFGAVKDRSKKALFNFSSFLIALLLVFALIPQPSNKKIANENSKNVLAHFLTGNLLDSSLGFNWGDTPQKKKILDASKGSTVMGLFFFLKEVASNPVAYSRFYTKKLRMMLGSFEIPSNYSIYLFKDELSTIINIPFIRFGWIVPFSLLGLFFLIADKKKRTENLFPLLWFFVLFTGIFIFPIQARYRLPVAPLFIIFAGYGVARFYAIILERKPASLFLSLLCIMLLGWFCRFDYSPLTGRVSAGDYYNLALAYKKTGDETKFHFYMMKSKKLK